MPRSEKEQEIAGTGEASHLERALMAIPQRRSAAGCAVALVLALVSLAPVTAPAGAVLPGENGRIVFASGRDGGDALAKLFFLPVPTAPVGVLSAPRSLRCSVASIGIRPGRPTGRRSPTPMGRPVALRPSSSTSPSTTSRPTRSPRSRTPATASAPTGPRGRPTGAGSPTSTSRGPEAPNGTSACRRSAAVRRST